MQQKFDSKLWLPSEPTQKVSFHWIVICSLTLQFSCMTDYIQNIREINLKEKEKTRPPHFHVGKGYSISPT